ncbi:YdeI family protein [Roseateles sp.]|uniref:YdeI/OmpD-associated family protein n=1 Tax=Roseateles sp. TaxID=1971397 RepID=UPI0025DEA8D4|nr:YdeI/OmpD-associated family protein [Roseateles sp.]MBV8034188.1 YdeI/OmpD-associated family protein [Roseateles sp.]
MAEPHYFASPEEFRAWLARHAATATELVVGFHKVGSGVPSLTWPQSVDEALCVGWIDGVRKRVDELRYQIRFTPRRPTSIWSRINIDRVAVLTAEGRMRPAGLAAFEKRTDRRSVVYAYEQEGEAVLPPELEKRFKRQPKAWAWFEAQPPGWRRQMLRRVLSAKQAVTRERRLELLIAAAAEGRRLL